jgi:integration host factor subunit alpha
MRTEFSYRNRGLGAAGERTVTKADIIESVYEKVGFSKKEAAEVVEMVFDTIKETLERGEKIKISGFGNFIIRDKKSRVGRNPQTGEEIEISARRVLTFRPSQVLKNALNSAAEAAAAPSAPQSTPSAE